MQFISERHFTIIGKNMQATRQPGSLSTNCAIIEPSDSNVFCNRILTESVVHRPLLSFGSGSGPKTIAGGAAGTKRLGQCTTNFRSVLWIKADFHSGFTAAVSSSLSLAASATYGAVMSTLSDVNPPSSRRRRSLHQFLLKAAWCCSKNCNCDAYQ